MEAVVVISGLGAPTLGKGDEEELAAGELGDNGRGGDLGAEEDRESAEGVLDAPHVSDVLALG